MTNLMVIGYTITLYVITPEIRIYQIKLTLRMCRDTGA
jgi:hypothetical protein